MIEVDRQKIQALAEQYELTLVVLFGSQATGRTHVKSDVDIAVLSKKKLNLAKLMLEFSEVFQRDDVEVVNLGGASPTLMYVVVRDGQLLYENEPGVFLQWKLYAIWVWRDTAWLRQLRNKKLIEWARQLKPLEF